MTATIVGPTRSPALQADWWSAAACQGADPEWWGDDRTMHHVAVRICLSCPVREPCLRDAVAAGDYGVIRGGMFMRGRGRDRASVPLLCQQCGNQPVRATRTKHLKYCGPVCRRLAAGGS